MQNASVPIVNIGGNTMKASKLYMRAVLVILCIFTLLSLTACTADMENGNNTELGNQFLTHMIKDDYDAAYDMLKETVTPQDFINYWSSVRAIVQGAGTYEMEQIGWHMNISNGVTTRVSAYQVDLDNGKTALLRITTCDGIEGIAGVHFSDITSFIAETDSYVPVMKIVILIVSVLLIAFVIWMFVDCLRRKIRYKVLWAILIFFGTAFTITAGEQAGLRFSLGLMLQTGSVAVDPAIRSVIFKFVLPVGAIVYFILRKTPALKPTVPQETEGKTEESVEIPAVDTAAPQQETPSEGTEETSDKNNESCE